MNQKHLQIIARLNAENFDPDDKYSKVEYLQKVVGNSVFYILSRNGKNEVTGYTLYHYDDGIHLEILRRGAKYKGKGIGVKLAKKAKVIADRLGLIMFTYAHITNLASINTNIKAGLIITKIGKKWISLQSRRY